MVREGKDSVFNQLSKEMAVFAQNNPNSYDKLQEFFLYELELRTVSKKFLQDISKEVDSDG